MVACEWEGMILGFGILFRSFWYALGMFLWLVCVVCLYPCSTFCILLLRLPLQRSVIRVRGFV